MNKKSNKSGKYYKNCYRIGDALNQIDILGRPIKINFNGNKSSITTSFGGFLTIVLVLLGVMYFSL